MTDVLREQQGHRERWAEVEAVFVAALDLRADARESLLASSCSNDAVRDEVRRLLARHDMLSTGGEPRHRFLDAVDIRRATALLDWGESRDPENVGRYQIVRRLGRGATGVVYLARDSVLHRDVALKLLSSVLSADPLAARRFSEEARAASALDHPHIATVYEFGQAEDGRLFIAMAYQEGETLRDRLGRGALPVDDAVRIATEIADGLSAAHARNIVHRDIKPENILLTSRGAVIVDFGIAKIVGHTLTLTGAALGTAAYMSPEQTRGAGVDHRSDLWSLGVVLYEMLTGSRPFQADSGEALVYSIRHDRVPPLAGPGSSMPPVLVRIEDRCLAKDPGKRYQSAEDLLSALRAPIPSGTGGRPAHRLWRRAGVALGTMATAGAAVLLLPDGPSSRNRLPLTQLSTRLPPSPPGALAVVSVAEQPSHAPLEGRQYVPEGVVDGLGHELIKGLSSTPGIRVSYRPSVRILVEAGADIRELGQRLGVETVLEWNLRHRDRLITVDARLRAASDGRELWSATYVRPVAEVGVIPERVRRSVARVLGVGTAGDVARQATNDPVAYDLYLRAHFEYSKWTPAGLDEAARLFRQAIGRDSTFALAYACLAEVYTRTWTGAPADRFERVKPLLAKALELDSTLALAHRMAGRIAMWQDRAWDRAEWHLSRALAFDPSDLWNHHAYAEYLAATGRSDEGLAIVRRSTAVDPVSSTSATAVGLHLFWQRRYGEATSVLERALAVDTVWWRTAPMVLGRAYLAAGRYEDAIRALRSAGLQSSEGYEAPALLAYALGIAGRTEEARVLVSHYTERARASSASPVNLAAAYLGIGDTAQALDWVEQIPRDKGSKFFPGDPMFDPVRDSPRFHRVLQRLNLSEQRRARGSGSR